MLAKVGLHMRLVRQSPRATNEVVTLSAVAIWRCLHLDIWTKLHGKIIDDCVFFSRKNAKKLWAMKTCIPKNTHKLSCLRFFKISLVVGEWREHNHLHMKFNMNTAYAFSSVGHPTYQYHPALFPGKKNACDMNDVPRQIHGLPEVNWDDHPVVVRTIILMATSQCSKPLFNAL